MYVVNYRFDYFGQYQLIFHLKCDYNVTINTTNIIYINV